ncbi:MAG TPA: hypothetical protein GX518_02515 [Firmicutes bacterium]|nr:hypothetical protein [Bacillota bacterium]
MIEAVTRKLLQILKKEVHSNTVLATHSDMQELASLPAVILYSPIAEKLRYDDANVPIQEKNYGAGTVKIYASPLLYNLSFDYEIIAETTLEVLAVGERLVLFLENTPYLAVAGKSYPLTVAQAFNRAGTLAPANVRRAVGNFVVEGVELELADYTEGKLVRKAEVIAENLRTGGRETIELRWRKNEKGEEDGPAGQ